MIIITTASGANRDDKFGIVMTLGFKWCSWTKFHFSQMCNFMLSKLISARLWWVTVDRCNPSSLYFGISEITFSHDQNGNIAWKKMDACVSIKFHVLSVLVWDCSWWRHNMETFSALLALCAENPPVTGEFPAQRPVTRSFDVFLDLRLNIRLSKQSWEWWFEAPSRPLWRHYNGILMACECSVN